MHTKHNILFIKKIIVDIFFEICYIINEVAHIAQLVEQQTENLCVTGSIPVMGTIFLF